jgi:hypothetical protein
MKVEKSYIVSQKMEVEIKEDLAQLKLKFLGVDNVIWESGLNYEIENCGCDYGCEDCDAGEESYEENCE